MFSDDERKIYMKVLWYSSVGMRKIKRLKEDIRIKSDLFR